MEYKTLIQKLENLNCDLISDESNFISALYGIYLKNDSKSAKELTEKFANFLFKEKSYRSYTDAFWSAREELDQYSREADEEYELKAFKNEIGDIQNFYRIAVNYQQEDIFKFN